jgi:hypothetical protein
VFFSVFLHFVKNEPVPMRKKSFGTGSIEKAGFREALIYSIENKSVLP